MRNSNIYRPGSLRRWVETGSLFPLQSVEDKISKLQPSRQQRRWMLCVPWQQSNCRLNPPCCRGASCPQRVSQAARGWRSPRWWRVIQRWRRAPAVGTPSVAQLPAVWGQHPETWEVCCLKGAVVDTQKHQGNQGQICSGQSLVPVEAVGGCSTPFKTHIGGLGSSCLTC